MLLRNSRPISSLDSAATHRESALGTEDELKRVLERIDGRGYKAYRDVRGEWEFSSHGLIIDHVQGDPFATPSRLRARVPMAISRFPAELFANRTRMTALGDWLARRVQIAIRDHEGPRRGSGRSGLIAIDAGGQEVLERSAIRITPDWVEARLSLGLPAAGRRVLGGEAMVLLCDKLPQIIESSLLWDQLSQPDVRRFINAIENQEYIRSRLSDLELVAFVGNGSILPRDSGASDRPLADGSAVAFESPPEFAVKIEVPNPVDPREPSKKHVEGMGIPMGVTLVVGGGYHGKSTLLQALESGVHPHIPGDGREWVVSAPDLVKIRAEDGRAVHGVDISAFIGALPGGANAADARCFSSADASGSTSQAANIIESLEAGSRGLLLDEDTSATNFMVRDARMQTLVAAKDEPITPFLDRVRELFDSRGVSTIIVMGGCGDYFDVAHQVIAMREYRAVDVTGDAQQIASEQPSSRIDESPGPMTDAAVRIPDPRSFNASRGSRDVKIDARNCERILYGRTEIDVRGLEQLFDVSQARAIGRAIHLANRELMGPQQSVQDLLDALDALLDEQGLDVLAPDGKSGQHPGQLARPRRYEIAGAINRMRTLKIGD